MFLLGCSSHRNITLFLKENKEELTDTYGKKCTQSGFKIVQKTENSYQLITYFSNCDVKIKKHLDQLEMKHWLVPKK
jgi:hypothetical protein